LLSALAPDNVVSAESVVNILSPEDRLIARLELIGSEESATELTALIPVVNSLPPVASKVRVVKGAPPASLLPDPALIKTRPAPAE